MTDKLTEILELLVVEQENKEEMICKPYGIEEAHSAILEVFKSLVPEQKTGPTGDALGIIPGLSNGFNECRSQLIANIERLRHESNS